MSEMNSLKSWRITLVAVMCVVVGLGAGVYSGHSSLASGGERSAQDTANLERRIGLLEQRFYSMENSINRLEQQAALYGSRSQPSTSARDMEVSLLRAEVESLKGRLGEVECGLLKMDERTLAPALRASRNKSGAGSTEPCRLNAEAPLRLSTRP
jgi:hypothetical protein